MSSRSFINLLSYIAIVAIGVALILGRLKLGADLSASLLDIANWIAYIVVAVYSYLWAAAKTGRGHVWYIVAWAVAIVLIVLANINGIW
jgi:hypothetical protein